MELAPDLSRPAPEKISSQQGLHGAALHEDVQPGETRRIARLHPRLLVISVALSDI